MPGSSTRVGALSPRLIAAVHPSSCDLLAASATELARRAGDMWEDDVTYAMTRVRDALEALGELFREGENGFMHEAQHTDDSAACDDAAAASHKAGWEMRDAARHIDEALSARARRR